MPGDDGQDENRAKYYGSLYDGPQPAAEPLARLADAPDAEIPTDSKKLPRRGSAPSEKPPPGMAELIVSQQRPTAEGRPQFGLKGTCHCSPVVELGVYGKPDLDPGTNLESGGPPPARFLDGMDNWSYTKTELREWLNLHRRLHSGQLELVIRDVTGYRIPWELLRLPSWRASGLAAGYLGAVLTVIRCLPLKPQRPEFVMPDGNPTPYRAAGPVIAYVAADMEHDRNLLRDFDVDYAASVRQVFRKLAEVSGESGEPEAVAMVYIACHAEFSDNPDDCVLGGFTLASATRSDDDLPRLREQPTLVFLNGCSTGSVGIDVRRYNDQALRGFAVVFLQSGAAGVLATTGTVGDTEAGELAGQLFAQFRADRDISVAEAVRRVRADKAEAMAQLMDPDVPDDEQRDDDGLLSCLYPFMYVYYGSPRLLMSIATRGQGSGTGEQGPAASGAG